MASFRETLWFKRGAVADDANPEDSEAPSDRERPLEDRYLDDGTVCREDAIAYSVRTGQTRLVPRLGDAAANADADPDAAPPVLGAELVRLVGELKHGRRRWLAMIGAGAAAVCALACLGMA